MCEARREVNPFASLRLRVKVFVPMALHRREEGNANTPRRRVARRLHWLIAFCSNSPCLTRRVS